MRQKLDVILGVGLAVLVVVSKILGTFCDFMIALANMKGNKKNLSETKINWKTAFNNVNDLTDSVLSKTKAALGPYLSTAFG